MVNCTSFSVNNAVPPWSLRIVSLPLGTAHYARVFDKPIDAPMTGRRPTSGKQDASIRGQTSHRIASKSSGKATWCWRENSCWSSSNQFAPAPVAISDTTGSAMTAQREDGLSVKRKTSFFRRVDYYLKHQPTSRQLTMRYKKGEPEMARHQQTIVAMTTLCRPPDRNTNDQLKKCKDWSLPYWD